MERTAPVTQGLGIEINMTVDENNRVNGPWLGASAPLSGDAWHGEDYFRTITRPAGERGNGELFVLSVAEMNKYFGTGHSHSDQMANGGVSRRAQAQSQEVNHPNSTENSHHTRYWLHLPSSSITHPVRFIYVEGDMVSNSATLNNVGFRPALWIRP